MNFINCRSNCGAGFLILLLYLVPFAASPLPALRLREAYGSVLPCSENCAKPWCGSPEMLVNSPPAYNRVRSGSPTSDQTPAPPLPIGIHAGSSAPVAGSRAAKKCRLCPPSSRKCPPAYTLSPSTVTAWTSPSVHWLQVLAPVTVE